MILFYDIIIDIHPINSLCEDRSVEKCFRSLIQRISSIFSQREQIR